MFVRVIASAAIIFALLVPAGTADASGNKASYQNCFEYLIKQYDQDIQVKTQEKKVWKKAAPVKKEQPDVTESSASEEETAKQPVEVNTEDDTNTAAEEPVQESNEPENETETETETTQPAASDDEIGNFEAQVIELTNQERSKYGLPALSADPELSAVAEEKSADMARNQYFSHTSPTYGSPFDMMKTYGIDYRSAGENIAMGQQTPEQVVTAWMNSEGHRQNILSTSYTHIGVGYVGDGNYWTQMFIGK
ncbi:CAP domain-containing protein [Jeotgalibacillus malaysiensis]|uniref:CAP domain-containing protein n=1 Tax=Jeotgalibacillus malaysiensis TaxID=1508404 RepID=UPI00384A8FC6